MTKTIIIGTNILLEIIKQMKDRGEISIQDYATSLRRNKELSELKKQTMIVEEI